MRGKLYYSDTMQEFRRITPADAGKTNRQYQSLLQHQDHPRGCGENLPTIIIEIVKSGSPPRMRGKPDTPAEETETDRITPADAGKTTNGALISEPL